MKLLVFSDSHGSLSAMKRAVSLHRDASYILFLGDGVRDAEALAETVRDIPVLIVRGNCDFYEIDYPAERILTLNNRRILMTHGHMYGVKGGYGALLQRGRKEGVDIVLSGHTHIPKSEYISDEQGDIYFMNPGSARPTSSSDGRYGIVFLEEKGIFLSNADLPMCTSKGDFL